MISPYPTFFFPFFQYSKKKISFAVSLFLFLFFFIPHGKGMGKGGEVERGFFMKFLLFLLVWRRRREGREREREFNKKSALTDTFCISTRLPP